MEKRGHFDESWLETAVVLSLLRFGGDTRACRLLVETFRTSGPTGAEALTNRLAEALGIAPDERAACIARAQDAARRALKQAATRNVVPIPFGDPSYPDLLWHLPDPPIVLWTRGDPVWLTRPAVAIVGSRAATPASLAVARRLARDLAGAGLVVVSGLARGVDAAAHEGALEGGGTVAVLGCGPDAIYPREHDGLAGRILGRGAIVSELPPGTPPLGHHFPLRNRIISGLSLGVVVVEAPLKSGSLITARAGLEQGRAVLAVPGGIASGQTPGMPRAHKRRCAPGGDCEDVLEELGWPAPRLPSRASELSHSK